VKPSPVPAAVLAVLVLASIPLTALWPLLSDNVLLYRAADLLDLASRVAAAAFLAMEAIRRRGLARAVAAGAALLAGGSRLVGVRGLVLLADHGLSPLWAYGVPALVGAILLWIARQRAAAGG
jgi:hypothetical protein